jgi:hypothetical protein
MINHTYLMVFLYSKVLLHINHHYFMLNVIYYFVYNIKLFILFIPKLVIPTGNKSIEHIQSSKGLIHRNHMASIINSVEGQVVQMSVFTEISELSVVKLSEIASTRPGDAVGQSFTTSPVADEILITVVDEDSQSTVQKSTQSVGKISDPISREFSVDGVVAFSPGSARDSEGLLDGLLFKEVVNKAQIVAEGKVLAGFSDIIDVELRGVAHNSFNLSLALNQSEGVKSLLDEGVAELEASDQTLV